MPAFGSVSQKNLAECHDDIQRLFNAIVKHWDCAVVDGARTLMEQQKNVAKGVSQTMESKHLPQEDGKAHAADVVPYPLPNWNVIERALTALRGTAAHPGIDPTMELARFYAFIGYVQGTADAMGIPIRSGADWDTDRQFGDHSFIDLPHHERRTLP